MTFCVFSTERFLDSFLTNYFESSNYTLKDFSNINDNLYFSYHSKDNNDIFQKGIIFKLNGKSICPLLYFTQNEIISSEVKLVAPVIQTQKFYGWKATFVIQNNTFSVRTDFYTDNGKHVTDGIRLILKGDKFERILPNKSEY